MVKETVENGFWTQEATCPHALPCDSGKTLPYHGLSAFTGSLCIGCFFWGIYSDCPAIAISGYGFVDVLFGKYWQEYGYPVSK